MITVLTLSSFTKKGRNDMEHWNSEQIKQVQSKSFTDNGRYTLKDIYDEDWKEKLEFESEIDTGRPDNDSEYREKLKQMFEALFDYNYKDVLVKDGSTYRIGEDGRIFLKLLLRLYSQVDGKRLRDGKYREIDFQVRGYLLYWATRFLKEREFQGGDKTKSVQELCEKLKEKFELNDGTYKLMNSLYEFTMMVRDMVEDEELKPKHESIARRIDSFAAWVMADGNI